MVTKESTLPTLRWKKTIGILAIVLGAIRFISGISTYDTIAQAEKLIAEYSSFPFTDKNPIPDLQFYVNFARGTLPPTLIILATIFILGIVLLCVDKGIPDKMPRPKSYRVCVAIFVMSVIYLIMEIISFSVMPSSISDEISTVTIIFSLGFVIVLVVWSLVGLASPLLVKNPYLMATVPDSAPLPDLAVEDSILNEINTRVSQTVTPEPKPEPEPTPASPLDAEIEELKKAIEKRKLEKELQQINAEKQAEIEQLKKELAELE